MVERAIGHRGISVRLARPFAPGAARSAFLSLLIAALLALVPSSATAADSITEFNAGLSSGFPSRIATGPDGNLWFTKSKWFDESQGSAIGKITPGGDITEYTDGLNPGSALSGIVAGPDGNIWFMDMPWEGGTPAIGRVTPSGAITEFSSAVNQDGEPIGIGPSAIVAGPDGNIWFSNPFPSSEHAGVGRVTPAGAITVFELSPTGWPGPLVAGPDGNVWFTIWRGSLNSAIGKITPAGSITEVNISSVGNGEPRSLTVGPDGNLWFTTQDAIGRLTPTGDLTSFDVGLHPNYELSGIVAGPDGNLWFTDLDFGPINERQQFIGRITPSGAITEFPTTDPRQRPIAQLLAGPDDNIWFIYDDESAISRITPAGMVTNFSRGLSNLSHPRDLVVGPDDSNIWFTDSGDHSSSPEPKGAIGRIAPVGPAGVSPRPTLEVVVEGDGTVVSSPAGIVCGSTCASEFVSGEVVTLNATPAPGYVFKGWNTREHCFESESLCGNFFTWQEGRDCTGPTPCGLTVHGDARVFAVFVSATQETPPGNNESQPPTGTATTPPISDTSTNSAQKRVRARKRALRKCRKLKGKARRKCIKKAQRAKRPLELGR